MQALLFCGEFLLHIPCCLLFLIWGVSLTHPVLSSFLSGEFLFNIPCWLHFYVGSFSYTTRADFVFMRGVCLTHSVLYWFLCKEFLLHISCSFLLFFLFFFIWAVSFTHPVLVSSFFPGEFLLHIPCWIHSCVFFYLGSLSYTSRARFTFICGVSLTHHMLALLFCVEFLLHIPSWVF